LRELGFVVAGKPDGPSAVMKISVESHGNCGNISLFTEEYK